MLTTWYKRRYEHYFKPIFLVSLSHQKGWLIEIKPQNRGPIWEIFTKDDALLKKSPLNFNTQYPS